jgi:hypothetical protein
VTAMSMIEATTGLSAFLLRLKFSFSFFNSLFWLLRYGKAENISSLITCDMVLRFVQYV